jgi:hypothetical protein
MQVNFKMFNFTAVESKKTTVEHRNFNFSRFIVSKNQPFYGFIINTMVSFHVGEGGGGLADPS